ncbi:GNAT family N-acetyltransferase [Emticicia agri]|uniref:GNAT family N-acetyltransferase n=1 Tax=Emticicia agri TaxID=2492393 RepID=A0A4Q5M251_9BACT|nr:GNAT family N-acetyltransferase [Emticicia agri]RYU96416.1 GNAT family N-acetyltransferase [Emticicia agri]
MMEIINATIDDLDTLMNLYDSAIAHQKAVSDLVWKGFDKAMVLKEIEDNRQWKIVINNEVACVFMIAYHDPAIWDEKDVDSAIYIHRISTNPDFRGRGFTKLITDWAIDYARANQIAYVRLDTWQDNANCMKFIRMPDMRMLAKKQ